MLRPGIEPVISFTGARDYARSAVATWAMSYVMERMLAEEIISPENGYFQKKEKNTWLFPCYSFLCPPPWPNFYPC